MARQNPGPIRRWAQSVLETVSSGARRFSVFRMHDGRKVVRQDLPETANGTVFACITKTANDIGSLPAVLQVKGSDGTWTEEEKRNRRSALDRLLYRPNPYQTLPQFLSSITYNLQNRGNCYLFPVGVGSYGLPESLYIIPNDAVVIRRSLYGGVFYQITGKHYLPFEIDPEERFSSREVVHMRINAIHDPVVGFSPLYACAHLSAMGNHQIATALEFYKNSAIPGGVLTLPEGASQEEVDEHSEAMDRNFTSVSSGRTLVITGASKFEAVSQSARDQQLVELLGLTSEKICEVFHIPPFIITGKGATYSSAEALRREYVSSALGHIITEIEEAFFVALDLQEDEWVKLDTRHLLRLDDAGRFSTYSQGIQAGWLLRSEVRKLEDLPEVPGIDDQPTQNVNTDPPSSGPVNPGVEKVAQENEQDRQEEGDAWQS